LALVLVLVAQDPALSEFVSAVEPP